MYLGVELLSYGGGSIGSALVDNIKQFSKAVVFIYTPSSNYMRVPSTPQLPQQLGFITVKEVFFISLRKIFVEVDPLIDASCLSPFISFSENSLLL